MTQRGVGPGDRAGSRVEGVRRIAVLRANGIGDFIVTLPGLHALRSAYPDAEITVIGNHWLPDLLEGRPGPWDRVVVAPPYPGVCDLPTDVVPDERWERFAAEHRAVGYDLAVQLHGGGRHTNPFVAALGARVSVGACTPDAQPLDRCAPYVTGRSELLRCLEVVALVGAGIDGPAQLTPHLAVTEADVGESQGAVPDQPFAVIHAGARDERRRWAVENFVEVGRALIDRGLHVLVIGDERDEQASKQLCSALGDRSSQLTGKLSLGGLLGLLSRAVLFVGNDSGPRHLAVAAGTPSVGVFWIGNALTFGPLVGGEHRIAICYRVECPICGRPQLFERCEHDVSFVDDVPTNDVLTAVNEVLTVAEDGRASPTS